jgi:hypothetical protein
VAAALILGLGAAGWNLTHRWQREPIDWSLVGTRGHGSVIVVGFLGDYGPCVRDARARLVERGRNTVDVVVEAESRKCRFEVSSRFEPIALRVAGGVRGRPVRGEARSLREIAPSPFAARVMPAPPAVVGLNVADAASVAAAYGYRLELADANDRPNNRGVRRQKQVGRQLEVWF